MSETPQHYRIAGKNNEENSPKTGMHRLQRKTTSTYKEMQTFRARRRQEEKGKRLSK